MDLKEEEILGDRIAQHWYYTSKAAAMLAALGPLARGTAIDVGSGSGFFARQLLDRTPVHQVDCIDSSYEADSDEVIARAGASAEAGKVLRRRRDLADAAERADLLLMMDVLEHVEDDTGLLRSASKHLRPGGTVFVTVPAFQWLWSGHDDFLGHVRRYRLPEVEALFGRAGLEVDRGHYYFGSVFPAAAAQRLWDRVRPGGGEPGSKLSLHSPAVNRVLGTVARAEVRFQRWNRIAGLSVVVVGHRP